MLRSIRWTLQLWHAAILSLALIGFGAASYLQVSRTRFREVDAELEGAAQVLAAKLPRPPRAGERPRPAPPPPRQRPRGREGPPDDPDRPPPQEGDDGRPERDGPPPPPDDPENRREPDLDLPPGLLDRYAGPDDEKPFYLIRRPDGQLIKSSGLVPKAAGAVTATAASDSARPVQFLHEADLREVLLAGPYRTTIIVGRSVRREKDELQRLVWLLAATGAGVMGIGLVGGWLLSRRVVMPIGTMSATAAALSETNLSGRIDETRAPAELAGLARILNGAFSRIEAAFLRQTRFTADASHELRTPLAVIHSNLELALSRDRTGDEYRQTLATCLKASNRMKGLIESLLFLARADAGGLELVRQRFDLAELVGESVGLLTPLAHEGGITLAASLGPAAMTGDPTRIGQVVTNLLANAIRHNRTGGSVRISTAVEQNNAILMIADTGVGIAAEEQSHVFERFFRADKARSRQAGGSGLGLAICKAVVDAHGGSIEFSSIAGQGTTFIVRLPA